ncbi:hypothetical protein BpHYR1_036985 [Brachionus plicatilis]|uniref:Acyltransferase 3 domain-containing protein n=1 Tax=Brachionus plicatilis TaxID=10195 RepID=A0A3M7SXG3_BRAPC|nr:hypothetical protein BpHYR1_036985 [Brachionus plicatilis]
MKKLTKISDEFNEIKRYNFLDGYRGMLAILVLVSHSKKNDKCELVNFIYKIRHTTGVYGFFVLTTCIKFGPKILGGVFNFKAGYKYSSWTELILLDYSGVNHLWTIAPDGCIIASVLNEKINFLVILFIYGLKRNYEDEVLAGTISARIWSSLILFLRLGNQKNYLIRILSNEFLCKCGLCSFGIYLLHPIFVHTTLEFFNFSLNLDNIIVILLKSYIAGLVFFYLIESKSVKLGNIY